MDELQQRLVLAHQLADCAGQVIQGYFRCSHLPTQTKAAQISSLVTVADQEAEATMVELVSQTFPQDGILAEEGNNRPSQSGYTWVIDPLDGTAAFVKGFPLFGILIGLVDAQHQPLLGIAHQPISQERWQGLRGQPSRENGQIIDNPYCQESHWPLEEACLTATTPLMFVTPGQQAIFQGLQSHCRRSAFGGDCYNYLALASGWSALPLVVLEADMNYYDFCALIPIVQGAGAVITDWSGQPLTPHSREILAASNESLHRQAIAVINAL